MPFFSQSFSRAESSSSLILTWTMDVSFLFMRMGWEFLKGSICSALKWLRLKKLAFSACLVVGKRASWVVLSFDHDEKPRIWHLCKKPHSRASSYVGDDETIHVIGSFYRCKRSELYRRSVSEGKFTNCGDFAEVTAWHTWTGHASNDPSQFIIFALRRCQISRAATAAPERLTCRLGERMG